MRAGLLRAIGPLSLALALVACPRGDGAPPDAGEAPLPAPPRVTDERTDLVFSYQDAEGRFQTAERIGQVPEAARGAVIVTDLSLSPEQRQAGRYVSLADLRAKNPDGSYPVAIASRWGFEAKLTASTTGTAAGGGGGGVVVYSTSWCGVCKRTKQLLTAWGVPFVEKDVEASKSAAAELADKARKAALQVGGVPVIDVGGQLLAGLDEGALRQALTQRGFLR